MWSEERGRSPFAKQMDAERLGFPKTSMASFWGSQWSEERPRELAGVPIEQRTPFPTQG